MNCKVLIPRVALIHALASSLYNTSCCKFACNDPITFG